MVKIIRSLKNNNDGAKILLTVFFIGAFFFMVNLIVVNGGIIEDTDINQGLSVEATAEVSEWTGLETQEFVWWNPLTWVVGVSDVVVGLAGGSGNAIFKFFTMDLEMFNVLGAYGYMIRLIYGVSMCVGVVDLIWL